MSQPIYSYPDEVARQWKKERDEFEKALKFYAQGGVDLEPKPEKAHLYEKDFPMNSHQWRERSMSDYWSGKLARQTLAATDTNE